MRPRPLAATTDWEGSANATTPDAETDTESGIHLTAHVEMFACTL